MPPVLTLLDGVCWNGKPVVGHRPQALLAALTRAAGHPVHADRLVSLVWGADRPANASKALQVLVSRTRSLCDAAAVERAGDGYRLGLPPDRVDTALLVARVREASASLSADPAAARDLAAEALGLGAAFTPPPPGDDGVLADLRREAAACLAAARLLLARATSRTGGHADALPVLESAYAGQPADEPLLADLLRSEAAVRGAGAALERYERYRADLRERSGSDPGEDLQRVHRDLLALDSPVREGVRYDSTELLGRDEDLRRLHALIRAHRVVSIVGAGGLGKTRLAHVLGRRAEQPVVRFVELVAVTSPEDLVGEVGSLLGVRDSVSGRRTLTAEQRADVRARLAQQLDQAPTLLILDNCEHIVSAVADLVAFLVATTRDLHVVTTSRAPLAIAAERVYWLGEMALADAVELFRQRAVAARHDVRLDEAAVTDVVRRLDGLPLAIELAAAKVRVMSVEDIGRRLENRFALLRGGDRSAPDRHQTLLAVIDWSWNLLGEHERHALRWLSVFHDGFTLDTAEAVLADGALEAVQSLADQSLLGVQEGPAGVRYRMLETVREFGRMQLVDAGEDAQARAAQRRWASAYVTSYGPWLSGARQFEGMDALGREEGNLADLLRQTLAGPDPGTMVQLLAALASFWAIRGDHMRLTALVEPIAAAVSGWSPPDWLAEATRAAMGITLSNAMMVRDAQTQPLRELLERVGPGDADPRIAALCRVLLELGRVSTVEPRLEQLCADPDRYVAGLALQWCTHARENAGDPEGAVAAAERALALTRPDDGPWVPAILRTQLAQLSIQLGRRATAVAHAHAALPVLERLGASDDLLQLHSLLAVSAIAEGRLDDAADELDVIESMPEAGFVFTGRAVAQMGRAELALARGEHAAGLAIYRASLDWIRELRLPGRHPTGLEPWAVFGEATALAAHALYGSGAADEAEGEALYRSSRERLARLFGHDQAFIDYPVVGMALFGLGAWGLRRAALPAEDAVRLLVLADRFAYNRTPPTLAWANVEPLAEQAAPGRIEQLCAEYGDRRGPELLDEARGFVEQLFGDPTVYR